VRLSTLIYEKVYLQLVIDSFNGKDDAEVKYLDECLQGSSCEKLFIKFTNGMRGNYMKYEEALYIIMSRTFCAESLKGRSKRSRNTSNLIQEEIIIYLLQQSLKGEEGPKVSKDLESPE